MPGAYIHVYIVYIFAMYQYPADTILCSYMYMFAYMTYRHDRYMYAVLLVLELVLDQDVTAL